jgi:UDP-MurNAc hydroxylase
MTYRLEPATAERLGREKRANQMARAARYIAEIGATHVVPCAGPPAFLDDELFHLNDLSRSDNTGPGSSNIFVDQPAFLRYLAERGVTSAELMVTGSTATLAPGHFVIEHPAGDAHPDAVFADKAAYLWCSD